MDLPGGSTVGCRPFDSSAPPELLRRLEKQQERFLNLDHSGVKGREEFEGAIERTRQVSHDSSQHLQFPYQDDKLTRRFKNKRNHIGPPLDQRAAIQSWNRHANPRTAVQSEFRMALGRYLELSMKLGFAKPYRLKEPFAVSRKSGAGSSTAGKLILCTK